MKSQRVKFYLVCYSLIVCIAILSLMVNIKSQPITVKRVKVRNEIQELREENQDLLYEITSQNRLENIETIARQELEMKPANLPVFLSEK